jgi:hypothetical protein
MLEGFGLSGPRPAVAATLNDPLEGLTERQRLFVDGIMRGMNQMTAARAAGYATPQVDGSRVMHSPQVQAALKHLHKKYEKASQMSRKKVMDGLLEAIEMAKIQSEPAVMVSGWREIGRMCGYYAAEKKIVDVNITAKRAVDALETMSDDELLEMIEKDEEVLEGEFTEMLGDNEQNADD